MGGKRGYEGVRSRADNSIEIDFRYKGVRCRETIKLPPTPANLKRASIHRAAVLDAIARGTFDYAVTFPNSRNRLKFSPCPVGAGVTLASYLPDWLKSKRMQIKASTFDGYEKIVNMLVMDAIGKIEIQELRRSHVRQWCQGKHTGNKWLANVQSVLRTALQDALDDDLIEANPLHQWKYVKPDAIKPEDDVDPFDATEREAILDACVEPQVRNLFEFAFWTGLRTSELVALTWDDIDWLKGEARINKGKTQAAEAPETPKTKKSIRDIKLLAPALAALTKQKQHTFMLGGVIFLDPRSGKPWTGDEPIRQGPWKTAIRRSGIRYRRPYQTRHTWASMMLTAGEPLGWVASQLGHKDLAMLARIYARWIKAATPDVGNKAVAMFSFKLSQAG